MRNLGLTIAAAAATALSAGSASAQALDYSPITSAVDGKTIALGVLAVAGVMVLPRLARMGANWLNRGVK